MTSLFDDNKIKTAREPINRSRRIIVPNYITIYMLLFDGNKKRITRKPGNI